MSDRQAEREQRVTPLELFFDLVFVFAITQVTGFLSRSPTWGGLLRGMLLLGMLWWAWSAYAWLTNTLDPEEGAVRLAMLAAVAAMLIVSLAAPRAFGADGVTFGVAYLVVRALHLVLFAIAGRGDHDLLRAVLRIVPGAILGAGLLVVAGFLDRPGAASPLGRRGRGQLPRCPREPHAWLAHLTGALRRALRADHHHRARRVDRGDRGRCRGPPARCRRDRGRAPWDHGRRVPLVVVLRLGHLRRPSSARPGDGGVTRRARQGRVLVPAPADGCGIVLFAFGLETTLHDVSDPLRIVPALGLCGGIALYLIAHVALRLRIGGGFGHGRPVASVLLLGLLPVAKTVPALTALGLVAAVCACLIGYEAIRYRESRAWIRSRRGAFTLEEAARAGGGRGREGRPRGGPNA